MRDKYGPAMLVISLWLVIGARPRRIVTLLRTHGLRTATHSLRSLVCAAVATVTISASASQSESPTAAPSVSVAEVSVWEWRLFCPAGTTWPVDQLVQRPYWHEKNESFSVRGVAPYGLALPCLALPCVASVHAASRRSLRSPSVVQCAFGWQVPRGSPAG